MTRDSGEASESRHRKQAVLSPSPAPPQLSPPHPSLTPPPPHLILPHFFPFLFLPIHLSIPLSQFIVLKLHGNQQSIPSPFPLAPQPPSHIAFLHSSIPFTIPQFYFVTLNFFLIISIFSYLPPATLSFLPLPSFHASFLASNIPLAVAPFHTRLPK